MPFKHMSNSALAAAESWALLKIQPFPWVLNKDKATLLVSLKAWYQKKNQRVGSPVHVWAEENRPESDAEWVEGAGSSGSVNHFLPQGLAVIRSTGVWF